MALGPGSIAFVGYNADGSDNLAFVALESIASGTQINVTTNGWRGTEFYATEGKIVWTATADIAPGTIVTLDSLATASPTSNLGTIVLATGPTLNVGVSNDSVYAYLGTPEVPTVFLAAIANDDFSGAGGTLAGTGLTLGVNALELKLRDNDADVAAYDGRRVSATDFNDFLGLINNYANWITQDTGSNDSADGIPPDVPFATTAFVVDANANAISFAADSLVVTAAEGDSGPTTLTFTVQRTGSTSGALDFTGSVAAIGTAYADDFGGILPTAFNGTIPDGATATTVSIEVSGDTVFEADESFTLTLKTAANANVPAFVADTGTVAVGTIVNDDLQPVKIAFVGFNADGADNLAFVTFGEIAAGTEIHFSDATWNGSAFSASESAWTWTATSDVAAGAIVTMDGLAAGNTATSNLGTIAFTQSFQRDIAASGEVVYAYLGTPAQPSAFIAAIANTEFEGYGSLVNTGLTEGVDAINLTGNVDIATYDGPRDGVASLDDFLPLVVDRHNWIAQEKDYDQSADGLAPDVPFSRAAFSTDADPQRVGFAAGSLSVAQAEGNAGTTTFIFTVERTGGTTGAVEFSGILTAGTTDAADFGGVLPTTFSGVIAAGATTAEVTVTVAGDALVEANETFGLELLSVENPAAATALADHAVATGTIVNDEVPQVVTFAPGSLTVAQAEGDGGTTTFTFTVQRSGGSTPAGAVDFTGTFAAGTTNAADFGGALPPGFSGTIAAGATSAEVTVTVAGDADVEADESFTLTLGSVSNAEAPVTVGAQAAATGTILNDEPVPTIAFTGYSAEGTDNLAFVVL
ncbi:MAG: beta strand repeat-containing protein, partial [Alphaproteobacteria bacterium]